MILLLHDVCDVLMEAAKMCKYCGQEVRPPDSCFPAFRALQHAGLWCNRRLPRAVGSAAPTSITMPP
jgi:hypothetical protein